MNQKNYDKLKEEVEDLRQLPGKQRGEHIKYAIAYVRSNEGEEAVQKVKDTLKEMDFNIDNVEEYSDTEWIPETITHIFIVASARVLNWEEEDLFDMGRDMAARSTIFRIFMKYFSSIEKTVKKGVARWNNNFTRGKLEVKELDKKNKKGVFALKNFRTHPFICTLFEGFMLQIMELVTGNKNMKMRENKCMSRGDKHHEFTFEW